MSRNEWFGWIDIAPRLGSPYLGQEPGNLADWGELEKIELMSEKYGNIHSTTMSKGGVCLFWQWLIVITYN